MIRRLHLHILAASRRWGAVGMAALALLLSILLTGGLWPAHANAAGGERLVLAFYYNWFSEKDWRADRAPDLPAQPYVSSDRAVMGRHIDQAKVAGIDVLVVNWYGPQDNNPTEVNLRAMLEEAAARGFRLAVDVDLQGSPYLNGAGNIQTAMSVLLNDIARHSAYLKVDGKPVVFFYHQNARLNTNGWAAIRNAVDPGRNSLWIEEGVDVSPLTVFDGHHLYSVTWANRTDMSYTANKFARLVRAKAAALGVPKIYVATVMPGYDDRKTGRGGAFAVGREDSAYYVRSWQAAIGSSPDWIVINSFNEWLEGTYIEPSQAYGNRYLELTAPWAAAFRGSAPPPPAPAPPPKAVAPPPAKSTPAPPPVPTPTRPLAPPEPVFVKPGGLLVM